MMGWLKKRKEREEKKQAEWSKSWREHDEWCNEQRTNNIKLIQEILMEMKTGDEVFFNDLNERCDSVWVNHPKCYYKKVPFGWLYAEVIDSCYSIEKSNFILIPDKRENQKLPGMEK